MALLVAWVSFGVCVFLSVVCSALYLDVRGQRRALRALHARVDALSSDVSSGPPTPRATRSGDDGRRTSSRPPPEVRVER
jgi:hypothetical protein